MISGTASLVSSVATSWRLWSRDETVTNSRRKPFTPAWTTFRSPLASSGLVRSTRSKSTSFSRISKLGLSSTKAFTPLKPWTFGVSGVEGSTSASLVPTSTISATASFETSVPTTWRLSSRAETATNSRCWPLTPAWTTFRSPLARSGLVRSTTSKSSSFSTTSKLGLSATKALTSSSACLPTWVIGFNWLRAWVTCSTCSATFSWWARLIFQFNWSRTVARAERDSSV